MLVDYVEASPAFCQAADGCHAARQAATRWFGAVPLPLVSILAYSVLLVLSLLPQSRWAVRALSLLAAMGGLFGLALLVAQPIVLKQLCPYCVGIDLLSLVVAGFAWKLQQLTKAGVLVATPLKPLAVVGYALMTLVAIPLWSHFRPAAAVPRELRHLQVEGKVTVVEFVDLECPHCRSLYPILEQLTHELRSKVAARRLHAPLRNHLLARRGARLLHCTADSAQTEQLERLLFEGELRDEPTLVARAVKAGMPRAAVEACWSNPDSESKVEGQIRLFRSLPGRKGLPLVYVNGERIGGGAPVASYRAAIDRVLRPKSHAQGRVAAFLAILLMLGIAIFFIGRQDEPPATATE